MKSLNVLGFVCLALVSTTSMADQGVAQNTATQPPAFQDIQWSPGLSIRTDKYLGVTTINPDESLRWTAYVVNGKGSFEVAGLSDASKDYEYLNTPDWLSGGRFVTAQISARDVPSQGSLSTVLGLVMLPNSEVRVTAERLDKNGNPIEILKDESFRLNDSAPRPVDYGVFLELDRK